MANESLLTIWRALARCRPSDLELLLNIADAGVQLRQAYAGQDERLARQFRQDDVAQAAQETGMACDRLRELLGAMIEAERDGSLRQELTRKLTRIAVDTPDDVGSIHVFLEGP